MTNNKLILAIETSCDETSVSVIKNGTELLSNTVLSQIDSHKRLVGAEIYGNDAGDLVNLLVFIINQKLTAQDLNKNIFAFPGASSGVIDLLKLAMM